MAASTMMALSALATAGVDEAAAKPRHTYRALDAQSDTDNLMPPMPRPARRPSRAAGEQDSEFEHDSERPIVPPVPKPAVRPQRMAAVSHRHAHSTDHSLAAPPARLGAAPERATATPEPARLQRDARSDGARGCLKPPARALFDRIEAEFGPMRIVSTCRAGARIAGSGRMSKHATGEAIDFEAGSRKSAVVKWLIANHKSGGTMTYSGMSHIHVDVGYHFVALGARSGR